MANEVKTKLTADKSDLDAGLQGGLSSLKSFAGAAVGIGAALAIFAGLKKGMAEVIDLAKESIALFQVQEDAEARLEAVLTSTGRAARISAQEIKEFAAARQQVTTFGDEATIAAAAMLAMRESVPDAKFFQTLELAQDAAAQLGTTVEGAVQLIAQGLEDPGRGLSMLERRLGNLNPEVRAMVKEFMEAGDILSAQTLILDEYSRKLDGISERMAETTSGSIEQMKNAIGDLKEEIGRALVDGAFPELESISNKVLENMADNIGKVGVELQATTQATVIFVTEITKAAAGMLELYANTEPTIVLLRQMGVEVDNLAFALGPLGIALELFLDAQGEIADQLERERQLNKELLELERKRAVETRSFAALEQERMRRMEQGGEGVADMMAASASDFKSSIVAASSLYSRIQAGAVSQSDPVVDAVGEVADGVEGQIDEQKRTNELLTQIVQVRPTSGLVISE